MGKALEKKKWEDMTPRQRTAALVAFSVQLSLAVTAWVDLARRPSDQVNGSKLKWAAIIAVSWVGPVTYFVKGRRRD